MAKNANLHSAKNAKKDEFYTQLGDIENELNTTKAILKTKWCIATAMTLWQVIFSNTFS